MNTVLRQAALALLALSLAACAAAAPPPPPPIAAPPSRVDAKTSLENHM